MGLKSCPFCGGEKIEVSIKGLTCENCYATYYGMPDNNLDVMKKGWNERNYLPLFKDLPCQNTKCKSYDSKIGDNCSTMEHVAMCNNYCVRYWGIIDLLGCKG